MLYLLEQSDIFYNIEMREKRDLFCYKNISLCVLNIVTNLVVKSKEFYRNCSSNDSTSIAKIAIKSLTIPLETEMGIAL